MPRMIVLLLAIGFAVSGCSGCSGPMRPAEMEAVAKSYFTTMRNGNIDGVLDLYGSAFYSQTPRERWREMLVGISGKLGKMQSEKLASWSVQSRVGTGAGTFLQLVYDVRYENFTAQETIVVHRPLFGGEPEIFYHRINSDGLAGGID